jgi:hypothetical protein
MRWAAAVVALAVVLSACTEPKNEDEGEPGLSGTCGLRKIAQDVDEKRVPDEFLLDGVEIAKTTDIRGRFIATVNAPYTVNEAYRAYRPQVQDAGWDIVNHETEGFEAEIYLTDRSRLAAIQVRTSTCEKKVVVYVSIVERAKAPSG